MVSVPEQASVLHPEQVRIWERRQNDGKTFYPEEILSATEKDDFTSEQSEEFENSLANDSRVITEVAKLLGVVVDDWQEQVVLFIEREPHFNHAYDHTEMARKAADVTLGQFVMESALHSVPVEGQIDGDTHGIRLFLRTAGELCLVVASENDLWYPEFEELTDEDGYTTEGEQVSAGGYSFKINVSLDEAPSPKEVEDYSAEEY